MDYEQDAFEVFEYARWGDCPECPRCNSKAVRQVKNKDGGRNKRFLWWCYGCKKQFTVRIGTELENSRIKMSVWASATLDCKNAFQIHKKLGVSYKSALAMKFRINHPEIVIGLNQAVKQGLIKRLPNGKYAK